MLPRFFATLRYALNDNYDYFLKKCKRTNKNLKNMLRNTLFLLFYLQITEKAVPLQCVFHSIRLRLTKVGAKRCSFFFALL